ncbi:hypothetical protein RUND412_009658 [Rhizina undulata]
MKTASLLLSLGLPLLASAHFTILYPTPRGRDESTMSDSPCGNFNTPSSRRTQWPLTGGQLELSTEHAASDMAVYMAIGNDPVAADYTVILKDVFEEIGIGNVCWNTLEVPAGTSGVADGVNATIQVVMAGESGGGLYGCSDITFISDLTSSEAACKNSTGISAGPATQAVDTTASMTMSMNGTVMATSTPTGTAAATTTKANDAAGVKVGGAFFAGVVAVMGWLL